LVQYIQTIASNQLCFIISKHHKLGIFGEMTLSLPKFVITNIIFAQFFFWKHINITSWIFIYFLFRKYLISFRLNLINYVEESNKYWRTWTHGICLWQNDTHQKVWKFIYIFQNSSHGLNFWLNIFMVDHIDIHKLNLGQFKSLNFPNEVSKNVFLTF
jgi:hypothetical protein